MSRAALLALCALAAARVLGFSFLFPFFHNVDELAHVDTVLRYARVGLPRGLAPMSPEAASLAARFGRAEYALPPGAAHPTPEETEAYWRAQVDHELNQPPAYYALAAAWWRLGELLGLSGSRLLHWLRLLQAPLAALLVLLCARAARAALPGDAFAPAAAAALACAWPQDAFFGASNDPLAAVAGAAVLCAALEGRALAAGLLGALCLLTKTTGLFAVAAAAVLLWERPWRERGLFAAALLIPCGAWLLRNQAVLGEWTGQRQMVEANGWTSKAWGDRLDHPVFAPKGALFLLSELAKTFWRGEFVWHGRRLALPWADWAYAAGTGAALLAAAWPGAERPRLRAAWTALGAALIFFVWVSVSYEFGDRWYPSRAFPFLISARLAASAAAPLFLLVAAGLGRAGRSRWALLALWCAVALGSEAVLALRVG